MTSTTTRMDSKGRLIVPKATRDALGLEAGDTFFIEVDDDKNVLHFAKAENPLLIRIAEGRAEYAAGRTSSLKEVARAFGVELDVE